MRPDSSLFEQFTLGIEEEFQIVDPNTRELRSHISEILEEGRMLLGRASQTGNDPVNDRGGHRHKEARTDITNLRSILSTLMRKKGQIC